MTELQMGLIGLGAAAVIGVLAYNKWQEHRHRQLAERLLDVRHSDVLLDENSGGAHAPHDPRADAPEEQRSGSFAAVVDERIEPVWHPDTQADIAVDAPDATEAPEIAAPVITPDIVPEMPASAVSPEPAPEPASEATPFPSDRAVAAAEARSASAVAAQVSTATPIAEPLHLLSPMIDYVASFEAVEPTSVRQILKTQRALQSRIGKPVHWVGYNEYTRDWERIAEGAQGDQSEYRRLRVGLQLVDRQGAVSNSDLSVFHVAMQDLANEMMAIADLPARQPMLDAAVRLDEFCASVDIQIGINVISQGQAFPGTKLRALAEAAGMAIDAGGYFVRYDENGDILFVLINQEAPGFAADSMKSMTTHALTFLLDVPRVAHGERVFNQMVDLARRFADVLHGTLVDDNRRPLSDNALEPIRQQVAHFQSVMAAQSFPAGSPLTQRLFS